jgi:hypothetical protein
LNKETKAMLGDVLTLNVGVGIYVGEDAVNLPCVW